MRNRLLLIGLTILAWLTLKVIDYLVPWPAVSFLLVGMVLVMLFHGAWLFMAQRRRPHGIKSGKHEKRQEQWQPSVDLLIPAKNEARVIEKTIRTFCRINYPDYRVWLVDDNSTDETVNIVTKLQTEFPHLRLFVRHSGSHPGKSAALNDVLPLCKSEVIGVFDADAEVTPDFLTGILPVLAQEGVGAIQAQKRFYPNQTSVLAQCQDAEYAIDTYFQIGRDRIGGAVELRGNGQLIKRSALIDVGGWNNQAITDDLDLTMRLLIAKWDIRFCPDSIVLEEAVPTIPGLFRQRRRWAEGSIRRYLDYIFPLNTPAHVSVVERLDMLAFLSEFAVPALMGLELISELAAYLTGQATHMRFVLVMSTIIYLISLMNFAVALHIHRGTTWLQSLWRSIIANSYLYVLWLPVVIVSFAHIALRRNASPWHRTEHVG